MLLDKRIGIVGGGQLGKMMLLEAKRLGFYAAVLDPAEDCPASSVCDLLIKSGFDDESGYLELAGHSDVLTYEFEHINADALEKLENMGHVVYPSVTALKTIKNKISQKTALKNAGIPVPRFAPVSSVDDILKRGEEFGYPLMLKTAMGGYDGKGNSLVSDAAAAPNAFKELGGGIGELMAEEFIGFEKEISIIAARGIDGGRVVYPVAENIHVNSILDTTIAPARISAEAADSARKIAAQVMDVFSGVGTFCIEMFLADGGIFVNEVAPRPHNSGHYTIEATFANQFENHIRAIVGLPLGDAGLIYPAVMVNLLGQSDGKPHVIGIEEACKDPALHVHIYGKRESKIGRKMGHFTVVDKDVRAALEKAAAAKGILAVTAT